MAAPKANNGKKNPGMAPGPHKKVKIFGTGSWHDAHCKIFTTEQAPGLFPTNCTIHLSATDGEKYSNQAVSVLQTRQKLLQSHKQAQQKSSFLAFLPANPRLTSLSPKLNQMANEARLRRRARQELLRRGRWNSIKRFEDRGGIAEQDTWAPLD